MFFSAGAKAAVHLRDWLSEQSQLLLEVLGCGREICMISVEGKI